MYKTAQGAVGWWVARVATKSRSVTTFGGEQGSQFIILVVRDILIRWSGRDGFVEKWPVASSTTYV